jgi:hypothetical protein
MVREAKVEQSFAVREDKTATEFTIGRVTQGRLVVGTLVMMFAAFLAVVALIFGLMLVSFVSNGSRPDLLQGIVLLGVAVAAGGISWLGYKWGVKKSDAVIRLDRKGIVAKKTLYRWENIRSIGYDNGMANQPIRLLNTNTIGGSGAALGAQMSAQYGYQIYILHGTKKVTIVSGLQDHEAELAYDAFAKACARFGYAFNS